MKEVYSYEEIGADIDRGKRVVLTCYPEARVTIVQKSPASDTITATIELFVREACVGSLEYEYASILAVLDAFDVDVSCEIWEVVSWTPALKGFH